MANTNDDSDIELELEQMRRALAQPEPIASNQNHALVANTQNHALVANTQNVEPIASNQNIELHPRKPYTSSYIAIGLLIVGVGAGFFTLHKAQQWTLAKSKSVIAQVETVKNSPDTKSEECDRPGSQCLCFYFSRSKARVGNFWGIFFGSNDRVGYEWR